jgi:polyvinyl alcohol dehydrogenase (cytochrome)
VLRALDASTGTEKWQIRTDDHRLASGFSAPVVFERYVIVGSSSIEETAVSEGATFRGGVVAYDRDTGAELWRYYTENPPYNGASVWSTVSVDAEARQVFGTTGNNYTGEGGPMSDAIFALDVDTGALVWANQLTEGDVFTILNPQSPDSDFGTNPILIDIKIDGEPRKLLGAGQKSGVFWVLDRENGQVIWSRALSQGSALIGGVLNNGAFDGERILVAGSNPRTRAESILYALDPATGDVLWQRQIANWVWAPITSANGIGIVSTDLEMRVFNAATGDELFVLPTEGTISCGASIADGRIYVGSGTGYIATTGNRHLYALALPGDAPPTPQPSATPPPVPGDSFTEIYDEIFVGTGCAGGGCHGSGAGELSMETKEIAYNELVDVPAGGAPCVSSGLIRVVPGDPDASLLVNKISGDPVCGDTMPIAGSLTEEQIERIRSWIARGAPND